MTAFVATMTKPATNANAERKIVLPTGPSRANIRRLRLASMNGVPIVIQRASLSSGRL